MGTPQFNVKTGADTQFYITREKVSGSTEGKIVASDVVNGLLQEYPVLIRRTGDSLEGTTDTIESNELRKGRTKSKPRLGSSSSEGDLNLEFSSYTYDDLLESVFRGKWKDWKSDNDTSLVLEKEYGTFSDYEFASKIADQESSCPKSILVGTGDNAVLKHSKPDKLEIKELVCGNNVVKYSFLKEYGGVDGEELYQDFQHLSANTFSIDVSPGEIVTGSFGFIGTNDPAMLSKDGITTEIASRLDDTGADAGKEWVQSLLTKYATKTDQFTAREGFLFVDGKRVRYGSQLSLSLNNNLEKLFAIFEKDSIATTALTLDISGNLSAYLTVTADSSATADKKSLTAQDLYNLAQSNASFELLWCFQDKEVDPDNAYIFQIPVASFTSKSASTSGAGSIEPSFNWESHGEKAMRIFNIRKRPIGKMEITSDGALEITLSNEKADLSETDFSVVCTLDGEVAATTVSTSGTTSATCSAPTGYDSTKKIVYMVTYNGFTTVVSK